MSRSMRLFFKLIDASAWSALSYVLFLGIVIAVQYSYFRFMPMSHWITYHDMVIEGNQLVDSPFNVKSYASHKRPVSIHYNDVLKCLSATGKITNFSSQPFDIAYHFPPDTDDVPVAGTGYGSGEDVYVSPWQYTQAVPKKPATCKIQGLQQIYLPFGIIKKSVVTTMPFEFVYYNEWRKSKGADQ